MPSTNAARASTLPPSPAPAARASGLEPIALALLDTLLESCAPGATVVIDCGSDAFDCDPESLIGFILRECPGVRRANTPRGTTLITQHSRVFKRWSIEVRP